MPQHTVTWNWPTIKQLAVEAYKDFTKDEAPRMGAALAYYTALSVAPLLIITIAVAGFLLGEEAARGELMSQISGLVGLEGGRAIESMIAGARNKGTGTMASILGALTLLWGATSVVGELRASLNKVWDVQEPSGGIKATIKERSYLMGLVLGCGFLLVVSLAVSAAISLIGTLLSHLLPVPEFVLQLLNFLAPLIVITIVFAAIFKFVPAANIAWSDVLPGAIFTAILFSMGKFVIGLYLGKASIGSTYGAAGSLVLLLVWVYYSSQIFFYGAELTQAYSRLHGTDLLTRRKERKPKHVPERLEDADKRELPHEVAAGGSGLRHDDRSLPAESIASNVGAGLGVGVIAAKVFRVLRGGH